MKVLLTALLIIVSTWAFSQEDYSVAKKLEHLIIEIGHHYIDLDTSQVDFYWIANFSESVIKDDNGDEYQIWDCGKKDCSIWHLQRFSGAIYSIGGYEWEPVYEQGFSLIPNNSLKK